MHRKVLILWTVSLALTAAAGVVYGRWTNRWGVPVDLQAAAKRLEAFPRRLGDWQAVEDIPMPLEVVRTLECAGYVHRTYVNERTKQTLTVAIYIGPPGPISVHTPEICYSSRAMTIKEPAREVALREPDGPTSSFWRIVFQSRNAGAAEQSVYYAWSDGGAWVAASAPRFTFGGGAKLYKIQMAGLNGQIARGDLDDPCKDFLVQLLQSDWALDEAS